LADIIPQNTILTISVTATTTIGKPLSSEDLKKVTDGCDAVLALDEHKRKVFAILLYYALILTLIYERMNAENIDIWLY
jgi:predicted nucleic acid-binding Zn ribbon protein